MSPSPRSQFPSTVIANVPLCREHFRLVLGVDAFPPTEPAQFIQIACSDRAAIEEGDRDIEWSPGAPPIAAAPDLAGPVAFIRRPFSLAGRRDLTASVEVDVIHRVVGVGTDWLSRLAPGDPVSLLGPLGNRFKLPPANSTALLVGGGVGIPPMLYLAGALGLERRSGVAFCGALTRDLIPLTMTGNPLSDGDRARPEMIISEFARHGIPSVVSTDDGSFGFRGYVTQALDAYLDDTGIPQRNSQHSAPSTQNSPFTLYTCGPEPMMKRVAEIAASRGIPCQIAVERAMACGMGTCQSCVIKLRTPTPVAGHDWAYRLACTDGPVFAGADLLW